MNNTAYNEIEEMIYRNTEDAIESAAKGQLCPHWQECARRELEPYLQPAHGNAERANHLKERLEEVINSVPQISDYEYEVQQAAALGCRVVYYYETSDYWTHMEIFEIDHPDYKYTASISIDRECAGEHPDIYALHMRDCLEEWAVANGLTVPEGKRVSAEEFREEVHFRKIEEILQYFATVLAQPELMLT